tara:strand:- start:280 stop:663 length:384 start_codon:yes stop_codon:yes gene_type:complete
MKNLSPALSIYKFPITAISSIANRISGIYMTGFGITSGLFFLSSETTKNTFYDYYFNLEFYKQRLINCTVLYPIGYHFLGGIRHLVWDMYPNLLTKPSVTKSSKFLFLAAIFPTIFLERNIDKFNYI